MENERITDLELLKERFSCDAEKTLSSIYLWYRQDFMDFGKSMIDENALVIDAFQDSVIALYQNLLNERIQSNSASVKTYLFEIGKRKIFSAIRKTSKEVLEEDPLSSVAVEEDRNLSNMDQEDKMKKAINKLNITCQKLLILFYYRKYSIDAIMHSLDMKNENSVKANKSRCIKKLKSILTSDNNER